MAIERLVRVSKGQRVRSLQHAWYGESSGEQHKLDVGSDVQNVKRQGAATCGQHALTVFVLLALLLLAAQIVRIPAQVLCLKMMHISVHQKVEVEKVLLV